MMQGWVISEAMIKRLPLHSEERGQAIQGKDWFAVGEYKKLPNEGRPERIRDCAS